MTGKSVDLSKVVWLDAEPCELPSDFCFQDVEIPVTVVGVDAAGNTFDLSSLPLANVIYEEWASEELIRDFTLQSFGVTEAMLQEILVEVTQPDVIVEK